MARAHRAELHAQQEAHAAQMHDKVAAMRRELGAISAEAKARHESLAEKEREAAAAAAKLEHRLASEQRAAASQLAEAVDEALAKAARAQAVAVEEAAEAAQRSTRAEMARQAERERQQAAAEAERRLEAAMTAAERHREMEMAAAERRLEMELKAARAAGDAAVSRAESMAAEGRMLSMHQTEMELQTMRARRLDFLVCERRVCTPCVNAVV